MAAPPAGKPAAPPQSTPATKPAPAAPSTPDAQAAPAAQPADAPAGDAPPTLSSLKLPLEKLERWGTRSFEYRMLDDGTWTSVGSFVLKTAVADGRFTLSDHFDITYRGQPMVVDTTVSAPLAGCLRPDAIEAEGTTDDGDGKTFKAEATLDATTLHKGKREKAAPTETVTDVGLYRLVTLLGSARASADRRQPADGREGLIAGRGTPRFSDTSRSSARPLDEARPAIPHL